MTFQQTPIYPPAKGLHYMKSKLCIAVAMYLPNNTFAREEFFPMVDSIDSFFMAVSFPLFQAPPFFGPTHNVTHISYPFLQFPLLPPFDGNVFLLTPSSGAVSRLASRDPSIHPWMKVDESRE